MVKRLAITSVQIKDREYTAYIALDQNRNFWDFQIFEPQEKTLLNRIYIGRVDRVLPNIQAVFVRIRPDLDCFLPLSQVQHAIFTKKLSQNKPVCQGEELIVQVVKDAVKTKQPVVSTQLTLTGRYSVLTTEKKDLSVSRKLTKPERERGKELLKRLCPEHHAKGYGIVLRTNSSQTGLCEVEKDVLDLKEKFLHIKENAGHLTAYSLLYESTPEYIQRLQAIRDFSQAESGGADSADDTEKRSGNYDGIYTDNPAIYEQIAATLPYLKEQGILHFYEDPMVSLSALYNLQGSIERLLEKQVWLPSGANIVIETTEAMTVIDVNTAKNLRLSKGRKSDGISDKSTKDAESVGRTLEDEMTDADGSGDNDRMANSGRAGNAGREATLLSVNKEAAREIARQLRLRNISGIIVIDFINMKAAGSDHELIRFLEAELSKDVVPCQFVDLTKLGLVELTRKKVHRSLAEMLRG